MINPKPCSICLRGTIGLQTLEFGLRVWGYAIFGRGVRLADFGVLGVWVWGCGF